MDRNSFNSQDICRIINKAGQMGVTELTLGDLHLRFSPQSPVDSVPESRKDVEPELQLEEFHARGRLLEKDTLESFDEDIKDSAEYAQIMIDDPVEYEKLQMLESLEDDREVDEEVRY